MSPRAVVVVEDTAAVALDAAERIVRAAAEAIDARGRFVLVLAGGSTPRRLYELLATDGWRERVPWDRTLLLFGDERCVPPDHERSNYRMVREALLEPAAIPARGVWRMEGERSPLEAATRYLLRVRDLFAGEVLARFDLVLLGVGEDGHTASLFPGTTALDEERRWVAQNHVPALDEWRLTMTLPALGGARHVLFLVTGEAKATVAAEAFGGAPHATPHPCERVAVQDGRIEILLDRAAASHFP